MANTINIEPTGVYTGVLVEDMIDTVTSTHKQYIKVKIDSLWDKGKDYPYTYVPDWAMVLPLKKDDEVLVAFAQNSLLYPYLYKNPSDLDSNMYEAYSMPSDGNIVSFPDSSDTVNAMRLGDNSYIIKTAKYLIIRNNNQFTMMNCDVDGDGNYTDVSTIMYSKILKILAETSIEVEAKGTSTAPGTVKIGSKTKTAAGTYTPGVYTLGSIITELLTILSTLQTKGSPTVQTIDPTIATKILNLKTVWSSIFI